MTISEKIKETENYVFSRLKDRSSWVIVESYDISITKSLLLYLTQKEGIKEQITPEKFKIIESIPGFPRVAIINKNLVPREVLAIFIESMGEKEQAEYLRKADTEKDVLGFFEKRDELAKSVTTGMCLRYEKWKTENR
jgi:hypothetical protein